MLSTIDRELGKAHELLVSAAQELVGQLGPILYVAADPASRFELTRRDAISLQVLMCVRVCSGLNGAMVLARARFFSEVAVVLRTVAEFEDNVLFLQEGLEAKEPTRHFTEYLATYFAQTIRSEEELREGSTKTAYLPPKKRRAAVARLLSAVKDLDRVRCNLEGIKEVLDGYVHGHYRQVMEMYEGVSERFLTDGRGGDGLLSRWLKAIALFTQPAFNGLAQVAFNLQMNRLVASLTKAREEFERGPAYSSGGCGCGARHIKEA